MIVTERQCAAASLVLTLTGCGTYGSAVSSDTYSAAMRDSLVSAASDGSPNPACKFNASSTRGTCKYVQGRVNFTSTFSLDLTRGHCTKESGVK